MAVWLVRGGRHGEYEQRFVQESRVYVTWDNHDVHLGKLAESTDDMAGEAGVDLEQLGRDQIAQLISAKFGGHGLARLVEAILQAQGMHDVSGARAGGRRRDILAGSGRLGFGAPRLNRTSDAL